jgi:hypothetical protein
MGDLTEAAKAEIAAAIAIVREDRFEKYVRASISRPAPADPTKDDPIFDPEKDPAVPPPPKPKDPDPEPPKGRKSAYWGEILED